MTTISPSGEGAGIRPLAISTGAVRAIQPNHLPLRQSAPLQASRDPVDLPRQLTVAERAAARAVDQGGLVGQIARAPQGEVVEVDLGNGEVACGASGDHSSFL